MLDFSLGKDTRSKHSIPTDMETVRKGISKFYWKAIKDFDNDESKSPPNFKNFNENNEYMKYTYTLTFFTSLDPFSSHTTPDTIPIDCRDEKLGEVSVGINHKIF